MNNSTTYRLDFLKPAFHPGLNLTVRRGTKWLKAQPGDTLALSLTGAEDPIQKAKCFFAVQVSFSKISPTWLAFEHAASARTLSGLLEGMRAAYPDFQETEDVVCLFFWV